ITPGFEVTERVDRASSLPVRVHEPDVVTLEGLLTTNTTQQGSIVTGEQQLSTVGILFLVPEKRYDPRGEVGVQTGVDLIDHQYAPGLQDSLGLIGHPHECSRAEGLLFTVDTCAFRGFQVMEEKIRFCQKQRVLNRSFSEGSRSSTYFPFPGRRDRSGPGHIRFCPAVA